MKLSLFSHYLQKLEKTTLRNEITEILADLFKKANNQEIDKIIYLCLGRLKPSFAGIEFNIAEKMMLRTIALSFNLPEKEIIARFKNTGDLGETAFFFKEKKKSVFVAMSVSQLYAQLLEIANQEGLGSQERKMKLMAKLINEVELDFVKYLVRIPIGRLRLGFSDMTVLDALSWMKTGNKELRGEIEAAFSIATDAGLIARVFKTKGLVGLKKINSQPGIPILPAKSGRLPNAKKIIEKLHQCALEPKIDGFRIQIHLNRKAPQESSSQEQSAFWEKREKQFLIKMYSRNLEDTTQMFPDIAEALRQLLAKKKKLQSCILDGEAVAINLKTKKPLSFQKTSQRKRKYDIQITSKEIPLTVFVFDLLLYNGQSLLKETFAQRRKRLEKLLDFPNQVLKLTPQKIVSSEKQIIAEFNRVVKQGWEGLMCKKLESVYQPGARNYNWVKLKKAMDSKLADTIDCLVLGYYRGRGKRSSFGIGAFLVGVYDPQKNQFPTIAKIGTGLTDKQWVTLRKKCDQVKTNLKPKQYLVNKSLNPDVWCLPKVVVEIEADEITKSPVHTASKGLALRFPRLKRFRDKNPEDVTTVGEVLQLHQKLK